LATERLAVNSLLYHRAGSTGELSPFDEAILRVAADGPVAIVSPYIGVAYLERIITLSHEWRLVSDVEAWLSSLSVRARLTAWGFIRDHIEHIHHFGSIHAKVVVGKRLAVMGSANLTNLGITGRAEMGILLAEPTLVGELGDWFEAIWRESSCPVVNEASAFVQWLDEQAAKAPARRERFLLSGTGKRVRARLLRLQQVLEGRSCQAPGGALFDLTTIAERVVTSQEVHYNTLQRAVEGAIEALSLQGPFRLRDVVARVRVAFAESTAREIYLLLIQQCANHIRTVFADSTRDHLTLFHGVFSPSTHDSVATALRVPRDADDDDDDEADSEVAGASAGFDGAALGAALSEGAGRSTETHANRGLRRFDKFQSRLLERLNAGERFEGKTQDALLEHIGRDTKIGRGIVERLLQPEAKALRVVAGDDGRFYLAINPNLAWDDLAVLPRTRAVCERLLGVVPTSSAPGAYGTTKP